MPKAKPVSLHPLSFDQAIKALLGVHPSRIAPNAKRTKGKQKLTPKTK